MVKTVKVHQFAKLIHDLLKTDRDVNMAVGGMTGEGKSTFSAKVQKAYAKLSGDNWTFDRMTWSRKELMKWIDGEGENKEGQLPEFSAVLPDELFLMFYSRNWYEKEQIDAIATFNMCRDRHLFLAGNVPNFWGLDTAFRDRIRFYAYIPERGIAWIFQQENNPFCKDQWNTLENMRRFRQNSNPYSCPNFLFKVEFDDWDADEKEQYLAVRNTKRVEAVEVSKEEREMHSMKANSIYIGRCLMFLSDLGYNNIALMKIAGMAKPTLARYKKLARRELKNAEERSSLVTELSKECSTQTNEVDLK